MANCQFASGKVQQLIGLKCGQNGKVWVSQGPTENVLKVSNQKYKTGIEFNKLGAKSGSLKGSSRMILWLVGGHPRFADGLKFGKLLYRKPTERVVRPAEREPQINQSLRPASLTT